MTTLHRRLEQLANEYIDVLFGIRTDVNRNDVVREINDELTEFEMSMINCTPESSTLRPEYRVDDILSDLSSEARDNIEEYTPLFQRLSLHLNSPDRKTSKIKKVIETVLDDISKAGFDIDDFDSAIREFREFVVDRFVEAVSKLPHRKSAERHSASFDETLYQIVKFLIDDKIVNRQSAHLREVAGLWKSLPVDLRTFLTKNLTAYEYKDDVNSSNNSLYYEASAVVNQDEATEEAVKDVIKRIRPDLKMMLKYNILIMSENDEDLRDDIVSSAIGFSMKKILNTLWEYESLRNEKMSTPGERYRG